MIIVRNRLVFGIIKKILVGIFKAIYAVLSFFHLQLTLLVAVVGAILFLTGVLSSNYTVKVLFFLALILSVVYAIVRIICSLLGIGKKKKRGKVQVVKVDNVKGAETQNAYNVQTNAQTQRESNGTQEQEYIGFEEARNSTWQKPIGYTSPFERTQATTQTPNFGNESQFIGYFRVKQNPNYLMAEYTDRYELFVKTDGGLKKVRTDYKY